MFRSMFGDPKPVGFTELEEALEEVFGDYGGEELSATITYHKVGEAGHEHFEGYSADIEGHNDDDEFCELSTGGYKTRVDLFSDLESIGILPENIADAD